MKKRYSAFTALMVGLFFLGLSQGEAASMHHGHGSGEMTPVEDLAPALYPDFPVGTYVVIHTDHMANMVSARGRISGAYNTKVYGVSYQDPMTGEEIKDHKWVIHEEVANSKGKEYALGDQVILKADHMEGMAGTTATITLIDPGPVYMVDYLPSDGSAEEKNHQWVTGDEITYLSYEVSKKEK